MRYFVSYVYYDNGEALFANAEWEGEPIKTLAHITKIEEEINAELGEKNVYAKLLFWRPFEE
ncbi:hypothetical protein U14_02295 [Candidatus Moduliflexus flocculans]|uniref:Uncharacterized protein n=1 Tax=Candidatus Moduliflexus flocculans TaxID=1499966 RepID=A0A0S6VU29_9BACT|nr:hypothetical protein U14_02295 [Candidatus Moduliflexus flocculans]